jgi:hypothetical protein
MTLLSLELPLFASFIQTLKYATGLVIGHTVTVSDVASTPPKFYWMVSPTVLVCVSLIYCVSSSSVPIVIEVSLYPRLVDGL